MWLRIVLCLYLLMSLGNLPARAETWRIASLEWPPYAGADLEGGGTAIQDLRKLLIRAGIDLEVDFMPWPRAKTLAGTAAYIGYYPAWPEEVQDNFAFSNAVSMSAIGIIWNRDDTPDWTSLAHLFDTNRVGFIRSYRYPVEFQTLITKHYGVKGGVENESDLVRVLAAGRVDIALTDPTVLHTVAEKLSLGGIPTKSEILKRHPLVLALEKTDGYEARLEMLNRLIAEE